MGPSPGYSWEVCQVPGDLQDAVGADALPTKEIALEERQMVFRDREELPVTPPNTTTGADGCFRLYVARSRDVLAPLAFGSPVRAGTLARLEVYGVDTLTGAGRHAPYPGSCAGYLLETLLGEVDAALEAAREAEGGWVRLVRYSGASHWGPFPLVRASGDCHLAGAVSLSDSHILANSVQ